MNHLKKLFLLVFIVLLSCETPSKNPNIILIMTDDLGWYDTGFNGNTEIKTPNMDKLAKNGIVLNRFYSASAVCSPTRASVITGRNPLRMHIPNANTGHMLEEEITLPEILKKQGYTTGHFGKWHLGTLTKKELDANRGGKEKFIQDYSIPTTHGYDEYFCTESKVPTYDPMIFPASFSEGEGKRFGWKAIENNNSSLPYGTAYWDGVEQKVTEGMKGDDTKIIMDRAIPFIEKASKNEKPFFSTIWIHTPHLPVVSDSLHRSYYSNLSLQKQIYYGTITAMDEQIGRLWDKLEALNISENTIIWFCSDNGPEVRTPGSAGKFRGKKRDLYEGGVRVPAFVVWGNQLKKGTIINSPMVTSDYLPTMLDILNIDYPSSRPVDGESLWNVIQHNDEQRNKPIGFIYGKQLSWVNNQYKLISTNKGESFELYNLKADKSEKNNIIDSSPEIAAKMTKELSNWLASVENSKKGKDY